MMTLLEAIGARHSVRKYKEDPIPDEILDVLRDRVRAINQEAGLHIQLVTDVPKSRGFTKWGAYDVAKGEKTIRPPCPPVDGVDRVDGSGQENDRCSAGPGICR
jgi:hypothetical protein